VRTARIGVTDGVVAVAVTASLLITGLSAPQPSMPLAALGYGMLVVGGLVLVARRLVPVTVLAVTGACVLGYLAVGFDAPAVGYLVAVYGAVRAGRRIVTVATSMIMLTAVPVTILATHPGWTMGEAITQSRDVLPLAWLIAAGAAGEALRQAERRAEEAERSRDETARRRADEERLHIARELHDSLTHQISVIKVQAEVAVHLARKQGEPVPESLLAIREAGREATRELRATLEALRQDEHDRPLGLDHLPDLVHHAQTAGLETQLTIAGERNGVPVSVDRAAYRIVQESLTNTLRHANATSVSVKIDHRSDTLVVRVDDDGTAIADPTPVPGIGLLGMRERVTALGGQLWAAPRSEGGFSVHAELPVDRTS
jgi:signal transduction histidine kinase